MKRKPETQESHSRNSLVEPGLFLERTTILDLPQEVLVQILQHFSLKDTVFRLEKVFSAAAHCIYAREKKFSLADAMEWFRKKGRSRQDECRAALSIVAPRLAPYVETFDFGDEYFEGNVIEELAVHFRNVKTVQVSIWSYDLTFACNLVRKACCGAEILKIVNQGRCMATMRPCESCVIPVAQELPNLKVLDMSDKLCSLEDFVCLRSKLPEALDIRVKDVQHTLDWSDSSAHQAFLAHHDWITHLNVCGFFESPDLPLPMMPGVKTLSLHYTGVSLDDESLDEAELEYRDILFKCVPNIQKLSLCDIEMSGSDFDRLSSFLSLRVMVLGGTRLTDEQLMRLGALNLVELKLLSQSCDIFDSDECVRKFASGFSLLEKLILGTDDRDYLLSYVVSDLSPLIGMPKLSFLQVSQYTASEENQMKLLSAVEKADEAQFRLELNTVCTGKFSPRCIEVIESIAERIRKGELGQKSISLGFIEKDENIERLKPYLESGDKHCKRFTVRLIGSSN